MAAKKGGLGRGLEALFNDNSEKNEGAVSVRINDIEPNRDQPRRDFDEQSLSELADSISLHGLLQPIAVRPNADGNYTIIAGERRWRACRMAGLDKVPVIIKEVDEKELKELALIENLQREDLNAVEEALGFKSLMDNYGLTQEQVSERMGKSRSAVANTLRLLSLNDSELSALKSGVISAGHARALLSCEDKDLREKMLELALGGASVRELEKMSAAAKKRPSEKISSKKEKSTFHSEVEILLKNELHRKVSVSSGKKGSGTLTIEFFSDEELKDFAKKLVGEQG